MRDADEPEAQAEEVLDGYFTPDVIQDGINYQSIGNVGVISAWYEYYPLDPVFNASMAVSIGDSMSSWAWEGDANCAPGYGHTGYGCFWYANTTTGAILGTTAVRAPNGFFSGQYAEAIVERTTGVALSPVYPAQLEFDAYDVSGFIHSDTSDPYVNITLINDFNQALVTTTKSSPDYATFSWHQAL